MRTFTLVFSALLLGSTALKAQTVATFDDLTLPTTDTFYINIAHSSHDVGFTDGLAYFPCIYDTAGGYTSWNYFSYSNKTDSVTNGYGNEYSAKTAIGYAGSANYAVAYCGNPVTYAYNMTLPLRGAAIGHSVEGFYITNTTYDYNSMAPGYPAQYPAKKFDSGDWFLLTIKGYTGGALTTDSVNFYLADYRATSPAARYIVRTWDWVNLLPLGHVDSLQFSLNSSDTAGGFGMNTPGYFCIDNFTTNETSLAVNNTRPAYTAKVYPNPTTTMLYVDITGTEVQEVSVLSMTGQVAGTYTPASHIEINTSSLPAGTYILQMKGNGNVSNTKFVKQ